MTRYKIATTHSVPIVRSGVEWWNIVDVNDPKRVVASHIYHAAELQHPKYDEYMGQQREAAQRLCDALNASGLTI